MRRLSVLAALYVLVLTSSSFAAGPDSLAGVRRVVFLGDSITYAGQYVEYVEAYSRVKNPALATEFLNLGLPSETLSGLSEPGHAGGKFPRPDLHERLGRILDATKPDLIVACYGMNDGIYHPFNESRFKAYQDGITFLRDRASAAGAKVVHLTPPVFDPSPIRANTLPAGLDEYPKPFEGYDQVLERYSKWLLSGRSRGWDVVDIHGPMKAFLDAERVRDPAFQLAGDGVHANAMGHWLIAREILVHWGVTADELADFSSGDVALASLPHGADVLKLVQKRQRLLKDAWLTATHHTRPGMNAGLPLVEAEGQAKTIEDEVRKSLESNP